MTMRSILLISGIFLLTILAACAPQSPVEIEKTIEFHPPAGKEGANLPFSEVVRVGDMLYLSGQLGFAPNTTGLVEGGIQAETKQTLENISGILDRHGSSLDRVVKCTVMLADISEWPSMNEVYTTYFPKNPPARSAFAANGLAFNARVEIECIAVAD